MLLSRQTFEKHALRTCSYWAPALWKSGPKFNQNCFLSFPFFCADYDTRSDRPSTSSLSFRLLPVPFLQRRAGGHCPAFSRGKLQTSAAWQDLIPACTCEERPERDHFYKTFLLCCWSCFYWWILSISPFVFLIEGGGGGGGIFCDMFGPDYSSKSNLGSWDDNTCLAWHHDRKLTCGCVCPCSSKFISWDSFLLWEWSSDDFV